MFSSVYCLTEPKIFMKKVLLSIFILIFYFIPVSAEKAEKVEFLRSTDEALQTSIYQLVSPKSNIRLKIIGVVHIGDKVYYQKIREIIKDLDYLYYEGIHVPANTKLKAYRGGISPFALEISEEMQKNRVKEAVRKQINFVSQVDFLKPEENWINADADFQQFTEILKSHNLGFDKLEKLLSMENSWQKEPPEKISINPNDPEDVSKKVAFLKKKMSEVLVKSAKELCFQEEMKTTREAIILDRNKIALDFLKPQFSSTNQLELGLLYGAAHVPNFVEILTEEYNFEIESQVWLDAWNLQN